MGCTAPLAASAMCSHLSNLPDDTAAVAAAFIRTNGVDSDRFTKADLAELLAQAFERIGQLERGALVSDNGRFSPYSIEELFGEKLPCNDAAFAALVLEGIYEFQRSIFLSGPFTADAVRIRMIATPAERVFFSWRESKSPALAVGADRESALQSAMNLLLDLESQRQARSGAAQARAIAAYVADNISPPAKQSTKESK